MRQSALLLSVLHPHRISEYLKEPSVFVFTKLVNKFLQVQWKCRHICCGLLA